MKRVPCHRISRSRAQAKSLKWPRHVSVDVEDTEVESDDIRVANVLDGDRAEGDTETEGVSGGVGGDVSIHGAQ